MDYLDSPQLWRQQIERRLTEIGSQIKGSQSFAADRVCDLVEQIEELRKEVAAVKVRQDKIAEWVKANIPKKEG